MILFCLKELEAEYPGRHVPTAALYGRVVEHVSISVDELNRVLGRFTGRRF